MSHEIRNRLPWAPERAQDEPTDIKPPANTADVLAELVRVLVEQCDRPRTPLILGPCHVLTVPEAIAVLGMREPDAKRWLAEHELIQEVAGRQRVIAGDLIGAIRAKVRTLAL